MPSQFFGLNIAGSGLRASNAALNTTANNISNAQTTGYSRQAVTQQASNALRTFTTYGCAGAGVDTIAIERIRNSFYDVKYWNNNCKYGNYEMKQYYTQTIEDYFKDDGKSGFKTVFNQMSAALQSVTTNASTTSSKSQFIASAKAVTDYFNNMYGNLQALQEDINLEIKQNIDQINSISEKIATMNKQINVIELSGAQANELRDQRELLIDELSAIVDVETKEYAITDANDPTRETGGHRYVVTIAGGQSLVDSNDYNTLSYKARESYEKINQTDADGMYRIYWENGNEFNLTNASMNGKLRGLIDLRDGNNGVNFTGKVTNVGDFGCKNLTFTSNNVYTEGTGKTLTIGGTTYSGTIRKESETGTPSVYTYSFQLDEPVSPITSYPDIVANSTSFSVSDGTTTETKTAKTVTGDKTLTVKVSNEALKDLQDCSLSDTGGTINIAGAVYQYSGWTFDGTDQYTFTLTNQNEYPLPGAGAVNKDAKASEAIKYQGIPYYMQQMNSWIRGFTETVNKIFSDGVDYYGNDAGVLFSGKDKNGNEIDLEDTGDNKRYYKLTAQNVSIDEELLSNADLLGTRSSADVGVEECGQIQEMITMLSSKEKFSFRNGTAGQMLEMVLADVALNASNANTSLNTFKSMKNAIDNQRSSVSGVDEDDEAVSLVKYQNSYTLASKMIQTLTEIYDQLILNTGV